MADTNESLGSLEETINKIRRQEGLKTSTEQEQAMRDIFKTKMRCPHCGQEFDADSMLGLFGFM